MSLQGLLCSGDCSEWNTKRRRLNSFKLTICIIGVIGNILNLITLRSPTLKTVPFIYIRALAIFDLVGLSAIIMHFIIQSYDFASVFLVYYEVWIEDVLINSLLVAGLYTALLLTLERYLLIRKPHKQRLFNIQNSVVLKIVGVLFISILLHSPMALQNTAKLNAAGKIIKGNNQQLLCREPYWSIFNYYKMAREFLRFLAVSLLVILNSIITKSLQIAKKNRRLLIKRSSATDCNDKRQRHTYEIIHGTQTYSFNDYNLHYLRDR
ncbi:hypothetical protein M3Y97_00097200 [Aphelenchoides bicaudatus]|nr:hypothetical protein M3Y97_00097200 [Aphelenchoides bicaudatus]